MLKILMLVSGVIEILFGLSAIVSPLSVVEAVGSRGGPMQVPTLALISLLGVATLGLGIGALFARDHLDSPGGLAAAYGLGTYNVLGAAVLVLFAKSVGSDPGLWGGAVLHTVIGLLFIYAFATRKRA
jgi:hypothetical protein